MSIARPVIVKPAPSFSSTVSLAGMLLCLFTCTLALLTASADHSGQHLAEVRTAFETSLASCGLSAEVRGQPAGFEVLSRPLSEWSKPFNSLSSGMTSVRQPRQPALDVSETERLTDANQETFSRLIVELNRLCDVYPARSYSGELAFDFVLVSPSTDQEAMDYCVGLMDRIHTQSGSQDWAFEVVCWADSPRSASLSIAALKAARLSQGVRQQHGKVPLSLATSARYWTLTKGIRPMVTLVVRKVKDVGSL